MRRFLFLIAICALVMIVVAAYFLFVPAGPRQEVFVEVPPGMGTARLARQLEAQGVIRSRYAFEAVRLLERGKLKAGEYRFDQPANVFEVYSRLRQGDVYYRSVIIPEGYNLFDAAAAVEAAQLGTKEQFLEGARRNVALVQDLDPQAKSLEGYLFPDTYRFQRLDTVESIQRAMVKRFRVAAAQLGLQANYHDVVTMASLIEKETPTAGDRPLVASVLDNRLKRGMPLMTDPTVIYAAMLEKRYRGTIYRSDLASESAYNTYKHTGLPPGPICSPGNASLTAAMHPAQTQYLYFVADAATAGHSRFASSLEEHQRNVEAYRKAERAAQSAP